MRIGIDFDNTIVCYDGVFHAAALERGLIPSNHPHDKNSVRDYLHGQNRHDAFTELQGYVYGTRMDLAALYPGVLNFIAAAKALGNEVFIVSHKTRYPFLGPRHDLHAAAAEFLKARAIGDMAYFELTKPEKVARAVALNVDVFIDDLPEILGMAGWREGMRKILFDPENHFPDEPYERYASWEAIQHALLDA